MNDDIPQEPGAPPCVSCGAHGRKQDSLRVCWPCLHAHLGIPPSYRLKLFVAPSQFFDQPAGYLFELIGVPMASLETTPLTMPYLQITSPLVPTPYWLGLWLQRVFPDDCPAYGEIRWHPNFQILTLPDVPNGSVEHAVRWPWKRGDKGVRASVDQALAGLAVLAKITTTPGPKEGPRILKDVTPEEVHKCARDLIDEWEETPPPRGRRPNKGDLIDRLQDELNLQPFSTSTFDDWLRHYKRTMNDVWGIKRIKNQARKKEGVFWAKRIRAD